jgi:hypothetical protein
MLYPPLIEGKRSTTDAGEMLFLQMPEKCYFFGRTASAVPWMKAWIFTTSSSDNLPVKSGMPSDMNGPLKNDVFQVRYGGAVGITQIPNIATLVNARNAMTESAVADI